MAAAGGELGGRPRKYRVIAAAVILFAAGLGGWLTFGQHQVESAPAQSAPPAVPVTTQAAQQGDVPIYLRGLGIVEALNTVEIKAQANGTLISLPVREGQEVHQGDLIAQIDPRPYAAALAQATAQRAEDQAQLDSAKLDLQRFQSLATQSFAPVQQVDDQRALVEKLNAAIQADTAAIATAQINLGYCTIRAPINGRVSLYQTDIGNLIEVASQTGIVSIKQDKPIAVVFTLPEADFPRVQDAMRNGTLPVEAYSSDDSTKLADGTLLTPNNTIDTNTGTISFKAIFANDDDRLWPGEFVNSRLLVDTLHGAITVPVTAIDHGPNGTFLYAVQPDGTVQQQPVEVGYQDSNIAVVTKGVQAGADVVVSGQARLAPGSRVSTGNAASSAPSDAGQSSGAGQGGSSPATNN